MTVYNLEIYEKSKNHVLNQLSKLASLADQMSQLRMEAEIKELAANLEKEKFEIIVVGEFANGKSTFINALLGGYDVLPTSVKPTTAILNKIHYLEKPSYILNFRDKTRKSQVVQEDMFKKIVAPSTIVGNDREEISFYNKNVELIKSIKNAEVGYPAEICKNNVVIIDSPGTNDLDPAREAITYEYIPKSDAAIILLHARKPLAESEMSFIKDRILSADIQKLFFVVNFKDQLKKDEDIEKVYKYIKENLAGVILNPKVYFVSSKHALLNRKLARGEEVKKMRRPLLPMENTGFIDFEEGLMEFLQFERGTAKIEKPVSRGKKIAKKIMEKVIEFERMSLNNNIVNLQEQSQKLQQQLQQTKIITLQITRKIEQRLQQTGLEIKQYYEKELIDIAHQADKIVESTYYSGCDIDYVKTRIETHTAPLERELHEKLEEKTKLAINKIIEDENRVLEREMDSYTNQLQALFSHNNSNSVGNYSVTNKNFHSLTIDEVLESIFSTAINGSGVVGFVIAGVAAISYYTIKVIEGITDFLTGRDRKKEQLKNEVLERFKRPISSKVKQFESNWNELTNKVAGQYKEFVNERISESENQLSLLLRNNKMTELEIQEKLKQLEHNESILNQIIQDLESSSLKLGKTGVFL